MINDLRDFGLLVVAELVAKTLILLLSHAK